MGSTFNPQILTEKLTKLNNSQQSIETLSHWCIFHMNKAKFVVEAWEKQFHSSPREQRLAFLYLANDILQNSRRKGAEFVAEFWRVLPEALRDVIKNGDEFGRKAALRLISIWDERKVFGSHGQILKEEFLGGQPNNNKSGKPLSAKLRQSVGVILDKIVSDYEAVYGGQLEEDVLNRCSSTIMALEKLVRDIGSHTSLGQPNTSGIEEELQGKHAALRECIEQLTALESSRASLVSHLKEAVLEQEMKLDKVRGQLRAAQSQADQVTNVCRQFISSDNLPSPHEQGLKEVHTSSAPPGFSPGDPQPASIVYTRHAPISEKPNTVEDDSRKSIAAAMAAKLTASTASADLLSHVLTSLTEGMLGNSVNESFNERQHAEKRPKLENGGSSYAPPPPPPPPETQEPPPPLPPFPHPDALNHATSTNPPMTMPPYQVAPQFVPNMGYGYGVAQPQPQPVPLPGYPSLGAQVTSMPTYPVAHYQLFQGSQPSSVAMGTVPHQQTS